MILKKAYLGLGRWQWISSTNHHYLSGGWTRRGWWWWAGGDFMRCIILFPSRSLCCQIGWDSSLINFNFSVTKMNLPESSMPVKEAVIALINRHFGDGGERRMVTAQRVRGASGPAPVIFSKLCKFLSNSESHDFICHNLLISQIWLDHEPSRRQGRHCRRLND